MNSVATYRFPTYSVAEACIEKLWQNFSIGFYRNGDKIILEKTCTDLDLASKICQAHGGQTC